MKLFETWSPIESLLKFLYSAYGRGKIARIEISLLWLFLKFSLFSNRFLEILVYFGETCSVMTEFVAGVIIWCKFSNGVNIRYALGWLCTLLGWDFGVGTSYFTIGSFTTGDFTIGVFTIRSFKIGSFTIGSITTGSFTTGWYRWRYVETLCRLTIV